MICVAPARRAAGHREVKRKPVGDNTSPVKYRASAEARKTKEVAISTG
jgi:hypothetical protein